jgi:MFS family permease
VTTKRSARTGARNPWLAVVVVGTVMYLTTLELFVVNVAIIAIGRDFTTANPADLSWILTLYAIVFAAALVPAGRVGDCYGRRRMFLVGLTLFLIGSLAAGLAGSLPILLAARAIQSIGAAAATPTPSAHSCRCSPPPSAPP